MTAGMLCCVVILLITVSLSAQHDLTRSKGELLDKRMPTRRGHPWVSRPEFLFCEAHTEPVTISCPDRTEIVIWWAIYGIRWPRISSNNKCFSDDPPYSQARPKKACGTSAVAALQALCNYQNRCRFKVENSLFPKDPCYGFHKELWVGIGCQPMPAGPMRAYACGHFRLDLVCPAGQTITMVSANWGRRSNYSCHPTMLNRDMTHFRDELGCSMDILGTMGALCNGKNSCYVMAEDGSFGADPCPLVYKMLEVMYNCS